MQSLCWTGGEAKGLQPISIIKAKSVESGCFAGCQHAREIGHGDGGLSFELWESLRQCLKLLRVSIDEYRAGLGRSKKDHSVPYQVREHWPQRSAVT